MTAAADDRLVAVDDVWVGEWTGPAVLRLRSGRAAVLPAGGGPAASGARVVRVGGVVLPGFCDAHVHLGLIRRDELVAGGIARVVDLGWDPAELATWSAAAARGVGSGERGAAVGARGAAGDKGGAGPRMSEVAFAGAFLTGPGGYPAGRSWAPDAAVRQLGDIAAAHAAVREMQRAGARFVKLVLHGDGDGAAATPADDVAQAVVAEAHALGLTVVAHAEGAGQAERALRLGVDRLAHTPWTERLSDDLIAAMAERMRWVSTLDIHGWGEPTAAFAVALDNLGRFAAAGGRVLYGTDLGNGPLPIGLNERELRALLAAGLTAAHLLDAVAPLPPALVGRTPEQSPPASGGERAERPGVTDFGAETDLGAWLSWLPDRPPAGLDDLPTWLRTARALPAIDLEEFRP